MTQQKLRVEVVRSTDGRVFANVMQSGEKTWEQLAHLKAGEHWESAPGAWQPKADPFECVGIGNTWTDYRCTRCDARFTVQMEDRVEDVHKCKVKP